MTNSPSTSRPAANRVSDAPGTLPTDPVLLAVAAKLLQQATQVGGRRQLAASGFSWLGSGYRGRLRRSGGAQRRPLVGCGRVGLRDGEAKRPHPPAPLPKGSAGSYEPLPIDLLADVLDRDTAQARGEWAATPLAPRTAEGEVLVVHLASTPPSPPAPLPKLAGEGRIHGGPRTTCAGRASGDHKRPAAGERCGGGCGGWKPCWKSPASGTRRTRSSRC